MTIAAQVDEVLRTVDLAASGPIVVLEQTFQATTADVWDALTDPARLATWFEPVEGDLVVGGRYLLVDIGTEGTIERCEAPTSLAITWEYAGDVSRVTATIAEVDGGARLAIAHEGAHDEHWAEYGPAAGGLGWDVSLLGLALHLGGDPRATPEAMEQLFEGQEGRAFAEASAAAWRRAHVEAGADPVEAQRAADAAIAVSFDEDDD